MIGGESKRDRGSWRYVFVHLRNRATAKERGSEISKTRRSPGARLCVPPRDGWVTRQIIRSQIQRRGTFRHQPSDAMTFLIDFATKVIKLIPETYDS